MVFQPVIGVHRANRRGQRTQVEGHPVGFFMVEGHGESFPGSQSFHLGSSGSMTHSESRTFQSVTCLTSNIGDRARNSFKTSSLAGVSILMKETAIPPWMLRPICHSAILIPFSPKSVPTLPITPGVSRLERIRAGPEGRASSR